MEKTLAELNRREFLLGTDVNDERAGVCVCVCVCVCVLQQPAWVACRDRDRVERERALVRTVRHINL